jgi:AraC-like DNA-binding protein
VEQRVNNACLANRLDIVNGAKYAFFVVRADVAPFRIRTLQETGCVSLTRFDHPSGATLTDSEEQAAERFQINIVERGWFRLGYGRCEWTLGAGSVFLSRPGDVYRYSHIRHLQPDTCLTLGFSISLAAELAAIFKRLKLVLPLTNRLGFLRLQLCAGAANDVPMALDTLAWDFLDAADNVRNDSHRLYRPEQLKWYAQRIGAARELMDLNPAYQHSLWHLASRVAMSPFLFARVFRELVGTPPHKYLIHLRLQRARVLLESGMSVTDVCYAVGFNNLSHFIRTFRAYYGAVPSRLKASKPARYRGPVQ